MNAGPQLRHGVEVELVANTLPYSSGPRSPVLPMGTRAEVESSHWSGGVRLVCIVTKDADEDGYRRFAIVEAGELAICGGRPSA